MKLEELRRQLRETHDVPLWKDPSGYVRLPDFDARKTFGLDPTSWLRKDWKKGERCEGVGVKARVCTNDVTAPFPPLNDNFPDHRFCQDCGEKWADVYTRIVRERQEKAREARKAKSVALDSMSTSAGPDDFGGTEYMDPE